MAENDNEALEQRKAKDLISGKRPKVQPDPQRIEDLLSC